MAYSIVADRVVVMSKTSHPTDGIPAAPHVGLLGRLLFAPIAVARFVYTLYMFTHSDMQTIMLPIVRVC